ncbi:hypothetical protein [Ekhidna sp.]|uniref:hypothetical protein n=1 Tax=Ekhidna sp. TaxID=2608089 RepID=UPI0032EF9C0B
MSFRKLPVYLAVLAGSIIAFHIVGFIKAEGSPVAISSHASIPGYALQNAHIYLTDKVHSRSLLHMREAVRSIEYLKNNASGASKKHLTTGLNALKRVESMMDSGLFHSDSLNINSVIALNALIYYEIEHAKAFIEQEKRPQAMKALELAIANLRNALDFAKGNKKEYEVQIFSDINSVTSNYYADKDDMIVILDGILMELEDLDVAYSQ